MVSNSARTRDILHQIKVKNLCVGIALICLTGCATGATTVLSRWKMTRDQGIAKGISNEEYQGKTASTAGNRFGPAGVIDYFRGKDRSQQRTNASEVAADVLKKSSSRDNWNIQQVKADPETEADFQAAEAAFQQGKLPEARKAFARLAKRRKGTPFGESAQFYVAECEFQDGDFVSAHTAYEQLVADYPGSRYLDRVVVREYAISRQWLAASGMSVPNIREETSITMTPGGYREKGPKLLTPVLPSVTSPINSPVDKAKDPSVKQTSGSTETSVPASAEIASDLPVSPEKIPWYARFTGLLPSLDVRGHAIAALEHVRHHDPTGPLADDATLLLADTYFEAKDYETASVFYDQFLSDFPKSPMFREAQEKAILAKVNSYVGPEYDSQNLDKARELIQQTIASYPTRPRDEQKRLYHMLDLITDQEAERAFMVGDYYRRTGKAMAAEFYLGKVIQKYPNSSWAEESRTLMVDVAKMPRKFTAPSKIMSQPGAADAMSLNRGSSGSANGMNGINGMMGP
ncbi:MAG: outer membrane protein assembly factor BamD [Planctomycetota bacterium]|nr:MAG: outer membrane protein assembly factor BamD [Planctomycetota bacterium]